MRKIISAVICSFTALLLTLGVSAADFTEGYIDGGKLYISGSSNTGAVVAYYEGSRLSGAYFAELDEGEYHVPLADRYTKIRVWFTDADDVFTVHIADKTVPVPTPSPKAPTAPTSSVAPKTSVMPLESTEPSDDSGADEELLTLEKQSVCSFSVVCNTALESDKLSDDVRAMLPSDGVIAQTGNYTLRQDMTVYDLLAAAAQKHGFSFEGVSYISQINGLSERGCGPLSGWMYTVNGARPQVPVNMYKVQDGDDVKIIYTCNMGNDLK